MLCKTHSYVVSCLVMRMKIALFGGTFDPIHKGHVIVAESAAAHIGADKVIFVPAKRSPHKDPCPVASGDDRLKMISLAIAGREGLAVSNCELIRPEPSYTLTTVREFRQIYGQETVICWLVGADSVKDLPNWHCIGELIDEFNLCVMFRGGVEEPDFSSIEAVLGRDRVEKLRRNVIATALIDISSTRIRKRLAQGSDVTDMLEPAVLQYIREHNLYCAK